jgi:PAS domain S-box-containing protein
MDVLISKNIIFCHCCPDLGSALSKYLNIPETFRTGAEMQLTVLPLNETPIRSAEELLHELQVHQSELEMQNEELRRVQVELEESRDHFMDFYDFAPVGYITLTNKGIISEINFTGSALLGAERNKLIHRRFSPFVVTEDRDRWHMCLVNVFKYDNKFSCELALQCGDGARIYAQLNCIRWQREGQDPVARIVLTDITERKHIENELDEIRNKYQGLSDAAFEAIFISEEGRCIEQNARARVMFGYTDEEAIGRSATECVVSGDRNRVMESVMNGYELPYEVTGLRKDGTMFPAIIRGRMMRYKHKTVRVTSIRDISDRKQAEKATKDTWRLIHKTTSHLPGVIYQFRLRSDGRTCIPFASGNFYELFHLHLEEVQEDCSKLLACVHPDDVKGVAQSIKSSVRNLGKWLCEFRVKENNGNEKWLSGSAVPELESDGSVLWHGYITDISEQKRVERERIDHFVKLREVSQHLVSVQENIRQKLSGELHDRTSPNLAAISINIASLITELPAEYMQKYADRLEDISALISDTSASLREIGSEMRPPLLDYAGLFAAIESYAQQFSRRTGISVKFECKEPNQRLEIDVESLLFRIVQEALTNTLKHARASEILISLHSELHSSKLLITDNGVGFNLNRVAKDGPIGLGLLNMREMAEIAGYSYALESVRGKGTIIAVERKLRLQNR